MSKNELKLCFILAAALLLAVGCPAPSATQGGTVSGTVRDSVTGDPIQGATVVIGTNSVLTNASGAFSFQYASSLSGPTDVFVYKGTDYQFWGTANVQINVEANPAYHFFLVPEDISGLPTITITGNLPVIAGTDAELKLTIANSKGGISTVTAFPSPMDTMYMVETPTFGSDCTVSIYYEDNNLSAPIIQYYQHVVLSASATLNITTLPTTPVTVNGTASDIFMGTLDLSPCDIPSYVPQDMLSGPSKILNIYNGNNLPLIWATAAMSLNTPVSGYMTIRYNFGPSTPFSTTVTLPASASSLPAPTSGVDPSHFAWDAGTRTISFTPATDATLHVVELRDDNGYEGRFLVSAPQSACVLPADFITSVLEPGAGWDCKIIPVTANQSLSLFIDMHTGGSGPINISNFQMAMADSPTNLNRFEDLIP